MTLVSLNDGAPVSEIPSTDINVPNRTAPRRRRFRAPQPRRHPSGRPTHAPVG